jgi:hypothetical protein
MTWENLEQRLKQPLQARISFPDGTVWLPETRINVDEWLTSLAQTDEELKELNIPRMRFLQNRWPVELLLEIEWDNDKYRARRIWAMHVRNRTYLIFSDGVDYQLVAAIEPGDSHVLYNAVLGRILSSRNFVPEWPTSIKSRHPHLASVSKSAVSSGDLVSTAGAVAGKHGPMGSKPGKESYLSNLSELFIAWIGNWFEFPVSGFYHEEASDLISASERRRQFDAEAHNLMPDVSTKRAA